MKKEANDATSPVTSATAANTTALAAYTVPRRGCTVSEVRIMPVEYSEVIVSAPSTAMTSWPRISPNRLLLGARRSPGPMPAGARRRRPALASAPMPMVTTIIASSVQ